MATDEQYDASRCSTESTSPDETVALLSVNTAPKRAKNPEDILPLSTKLIYGFPSFPFAMATNFYSTYVFKYYTDIGVSLDVLNLAYIIDLYFLVLLLPFLGWLFDKTNTRWGRRRPWIMVAAPLLFLFVLLIWLPPKKFPRFLHFILDDNNLGGVYYSCTYGLTVILTYMVQTPYIALGIELAQDFDERSSLFGYSQAFYMVGVVAAIGGPELGLKFVPNPRILFSMISIGVGILGTISFSIMCYKLRERPDFVQQKTTPFIAGLRSALLENKPFIILLITITFQNSAPYTLSLLPFWVQYSLKLNDLMGSLIMTVFIVSGFICIPLWNRFARAWGKRKAYIFSLLLSALGLSLMALPGEGQIWFALVATSIAGASGIMSLTTTNFLYSSLQGDVVDYDEFRTGLRREAIYSNSMQFFNWYMSLLSTSAPFVALAYLGFNSDVNQTHTVRFGLSIIVGIAGLFSLCAALAFLFYPISKQKYYAVLAGIDKHKQGISVKDPFSGRMISSPLLRSEQEFDVYWSLYTFAHWELRYVVRHGVKALYIIIGILISCWTALDVVSGILWYHMSDYYYIWSYVCLLATSFLCYNLLRLKAISKFNEFGITQEMVQTYLDTKKTQ